MASKTSFTPEEWARLAASPMVASLAVTAAEPASLWSLVEESLASSWALVEATQAPKADTLVKALVDEIDDPAMHDTVRRSCEDRYVGSKFRDVKRSAIEELCAVSALVDKKAPEDAPAFKAWLQQVAKQTAEADKQGSFMVFGADTVRRAEKATLAEIANALGLPGQAPA
jgi:hypothetical protein